MCYIENDALWIIWLLYLHGNAKLFLNFETKHLAPGIQFLWKDSCDIYANTPSEMSLKDWEAVKGIFLYNG